MSILTEIIEESKLDFLKNIEFEEKTPGRYFQKEKINLGNGYKQFYVVLGPNIESPIHNHKGENMVETHLLLYGSGKFIIYEDSLRELKLKLGDFHEIFSTESTCPDHKYIAGSKGSVCLALEKHSE